jgi:hypothetical protein
VLMYDKINFMVQTMRMFNFFSSLHFSMKTFKKKKKRVNIALRTLFFQIKCNIDIYIYIYN